MNDETSNYKIKKEKVGAENFLIKILTTETRKTKLTKFGSWLVFLHLYKVKGLDAKRSFWQ